MYMLKTDSWYLERVLFLMGGCFTLASAILAIVHTPYWLILTMLVGVNQIVYALIGFCPSAAIFHSLGVKARLGRQE